MIESLERTEDRTLVGDYADDNELPTNRLSSGNLSASPPVGGSTGDEQETTDWLAALSGRPVSTEPLADDIPPPEPRPSGMVQHAGPVRLTPTLGARLGTGLRRGSFMLALSILAVGALLAGGYMLATTSWLSTLWAPSPAPAPQVLGVGDRVPGTEASDAQSPTPNTQPVATGNAKELREGIAQYKAGNFDEAIRLLESSTNLDSNDAIAQYQLGLAYMAATKREHTFEDAEMAFRTAGALQPTWAAPQQMIAESLMRRGFYQQAITPALQATRLDPNQGETWLTLGRAYRGAGQQAEATQAFAQAARHSPVPPVVP